MATKDGLMFVFRVTLLVSFCHSLSYKAPAQRHYALDVARFVELNKVRTETYLVCEDRDVLYCKKKKCNRNPVSICA